MGLEVIFKMSLAIYNYGDRTTNCWHSAMIFLLELPELAWIEWKWSQKPLDIMHLPQLRKCVLNQSYTRRSLSTFLLPPNDWVLSQWFSIVLWLGMFLLRCMAMNKTNQTITKLNLFQNSANPMIQYPPKGFFGVLRWNVPTIFSFMALFFQRSTCVLFFFHCPHHHTFLAPQLSVAK